MSREDDGPRQPDPAAGQALPADAPPAAGEAAPPPDAAARVDQVPPPPAGAGAGVGVPGSRPAGPAPSEDAAAAPPGPTGQAQIDNLIAALPIDQELLRRKPEILVGAAFAVGFLVAKIVRRIGG